MNLVGMYRSILDCMDEAVCVLNLDRKILYMNPAAERLAGRSLQDSIEVAFSEIFGADAAEESDRSGHWTGDSKFGVLEISISPMNDASGSIVFLKKVAASSDEHTEALQDRGQNEEEPAVQMQRRDCIEEEIKGRDRLLTGVALATNQLLTNEDKDIAVAQALEILGYSADVDRVYIFENLDEEGEHFHRLKYEWARDTIKAQKEIFKTSRISYSSVPKWHETLASGKPTKGLTRNFPDVVKLFLGSQDVVSFLVVPIFIEDQFWGFIGFDDCRSERIWTWGEVSILLTMTGTIGGILARIQAEEALKKSEEKYRELVECANSIILRMDTSGRVTFLNEFAQKFFGYSAQEIIGKNAIGTIVPTSDSTGRDLRKLIEDIVRCPERYVTNINENMRSNGERVWIAWTNRPIMNEMGDVTGLLCVGNNITERKLAEENLKAAHEQLLGIIEFLPDATFVIDKDRKVIAWNKAIEEMTGISKEHILGKGDYIYGLPFYGEPRPMLVDLMEGADNETESKYIYIDRKDGRLYAEAFVPSLRAGRGAYVWATASPLYDDKGNVIGSIESIRDITQQKMSADELKRRDTLLAGVAAAANALLIAEDYETEINYALEILGLSANADRIYICENHDFEGEHLFDRIFEWCREGTSHQIDDWHARRISYDRFFPSGYAVLKMGKTISCLVKDLIEPGKALLESQGISSLLIVPIAIEGKLWGFIGLDDCSSERVWTQSEISILRAAAASIGATIVRTAAEKALLRSEENYRALVENINDVIFKLDVQGRFTYMSPMIEHISSYKMRDIIGQPFTSFIHPDDLPGLQASFERLLAGRLEPYEFRIKDKNGKIHYVRTSSRILIEDGQPQGFIGVMTDITKRKQAEEKLRETRDYLENLIDYANAPIIVWDPSFKVTRLNHAFERLTGLKAEEVLGRPLDILFPDMSRDESLAYIRRTLSGERWEVVEIPILRKDGDMRTVLWNSANIYNKDGSVMATIAQGQDITERKQAQEQIRFQASLLDQVRNAVIATDIDGNIIYWNKFAESLYQWTSEEIIGKSILGAIVPEDKASIIQNVISRTSQTGYSEGEFKVRRKDNSTFPAHYTFSTIKDSLGKAIGFLGVSIDITERKRAEEDLRSAKERAESATRAKSEFLANMSHEIRTPMNAVIGLTGLLLNTELTPDQRDSIETIRASGDTLLALINDILDFSKIEGGKLELESLPFDLIECVEASLDLVAPAAARKGLSLSYSVNSDVPHTVVSDVTRLRQTLANLLSNAVKFTKSGGISVTVSSRRDEGRNYIQFAVKDTGIGIPKDRMDRLFQSFSQIDSSTTRQYGGTGLGLAISRRFVELLGGAIWVESEIDKGSTFYFTIKAEAASSTSILELAGRKVLVITDEEKLRDTIIGHLNRWSMLPRAAESGPKALEMIHSERFDMAILDMQLKRIDDLIEDIRGGKSLPIVALGQPGQNENMFCAVLSRPIRPSKLSDVLSKATRRPIAIKPAYAPGTEGAPPRILLAEDNVINQKVGLRMLERLGYSADVAANGLEVLQAIERQPYDIILMDIQMPEMDGLEAAKRIRSLPNGSQTYIIAMTAHAMKGDREMCYSAGMNDYISKPVRIENLQTALGISRARQRVESVREPLPEPAPERALDPNAILKLRELQVEGERDILKELGELFISRAPARIRAMGDAIARGDVDDANTLRKEAHNLKSSSANIGALRLSEICRELELLGQSENLNGAPELLEKAEAEYERAKAELRQIKGVKNEKAE
jgi:PAS domain S-box-containing protein